MTTWLKCGECGEFLPDDVDRCPKCGMDFERDIVKCGQCGAWTELNIPFCTVCKVTFETQKPPERKGWFRKEKEGIYRLTVKPAMSFKDFER